MVRGPGGSQILKPTEESGSVLAGCRGRKLNRKTFCNSKRKKEAEKTCMSVLDAIKAKQTRVSVYVYSVELTSGL